MLKHTFFAFRGMLSAECAMDVLRRFIVAAAIVSPIASFAYLASVLPYITNN
jgi:hypothetical protein